MAVRVRPGCRIVLDIIIIRLSILIIRTKILRYAALPSFGRLSGLPSIVVGGADSQA
jgi:hypothetical protein